MTLEKILIFGVGIAIIGALTMSATDMTDARDTATGGYRDGVDALVDRAQ